MAERLMASVRRLLVLVLREPYPVPWWRHRGVYAALAFALPWVGGLFLPFWWNILTSVLLGVVLALVSLVLVGPGYVRWDGPRGTPPR